MLLKINFVRNYMYFILINICDAVMMIFALPILFCNTLIIGKSYPPKEEFDIHDEANIPYTYNSNFGR